MKKSWSFWGLLIAVICGMGILGYSLGNITSESANHDEEADASAEAEETDNHKDRQAIIDETQSKVVEIKRADGSVGSGFLYNDQGDIVTNAHVVAGANEIKVITSDSEEFPGKVIGIGDSQDVALVRVEDLAGQESLAIEKEQADVGTDVLAIGSPFGLENTVTTGIISGINRDFKLDLYNYKKAYQISAPIAPGNSGGPLIDSETGKVLGINAASADEGSIGFSIPMAQVHELIEKWSAHPKESPAESEGDNSISDGRGTQTDDEEMARELVRHFYESINAQDFKEAYSLLGSEWQERLPFDEFRAGYSETLWVNVHDIETNSMGSRVEITFVITAEELDAEDNVTYEDYYRTYQAGYENGQMTLLSGSGN